MTVFRPAAALLALAFAALPPAQAQTPKKTPPAKTLGGGAAKPGGKLLTRDELRSCLKTQAGLKTERSEIERERAALDQEKAELQKAVDAAKAERNAAVSSYNARVAERERRVTAFSARNNAYAELAKKGAEKEVLDRERVTLEAERAELVKLDEALKAEGPALQATTAQTMAPYNEKVEAWTKRNTAQVDRAIAWDTSNDNWMRDCNNRRYNEDDEIAIRKGK
jgi:hypothetical protein